MSQYITGTVDVTNASATITGTGTLWLSEIAIGDLFIVVGDGVSYEVASITNDTTIALTAPYAGTTATGASYVIARDFTPNQSIPLINKGDVETATILKRAFAIIDSLHP